MSAQQIAWQEIETESSVSGVPDVTGWADIADEDGDTIAIALGYGGMEDPGLEVRARLIAAAPTMLSALREIVRLADDFHPDRDADAPQALQEMREAIDTAARAAIEATVTLEGLQ